MSLARDYVTSSVSIIGYETKTQHLTVRAEESNQSAGVIGIRDAGGGGKT